MLALSLIAAAVVSGAPPSSARAALLASRGDAAGARIETDSILAAAPADSPALFVRACLELEAAGPRAAEPFLARLEHLPSPPPQAPVLRRLLDRRILLPSEPITAALAHAWVAASRPDLSAALPAPLEPWDTVPPLEGERSADLALVFSAGPARPDLALRAAAHADWNPAAVNLAILDALTPGANVPATAEIRAAVKRVGQALTANDRANGYLALAAWSATGDASSPITPADLALLEAAAAAPRFEVPHHEVLDQLRALARRIDPALAELRARSAGAPNTAGVVVGLWGRATATGDAALRGRMGGLMQVVAARLACSGAVVDRTLGIFLAGRAAELVGAPEKAAVREAETALEAWARSAARAEQQLGHWPLAAALRDPDPAREVEQLERLVGPIPAPRVTGFSCPSTDRAGPAAPVQ